MCGGLRWKHEGLWGPTGLGRVAWSLLHCDALMGKGPVAMWPNEGDQLIGGQVKTQGSDELTWGQVTGNKWAERGKRA